MSGNVIRTCVRISPGKENGNDYSVATNDRDICAEMTRYLASLGHKSIAFVKGDPEHKAVARRFEGYRDGLSESNLEFSEELVVAGDNSIGSGEAAGEALLGRKSPPTAIFAANDDMAVGVMRAATRLGVEIPGQLSVAGFDDVELARQVYPRLTTIRQPLRAMAKCAAMALLDDEHEGTARRETEIVPATIKVRESTGPAPG